MAGDMENRGAKDGTLVPGCSDCTDGIRPVPSYSPGKDLVPAAFGGVQGCLLALGIFSDAPGTQSFLFSRPFSRRRLFLYRWGIGLGFQALTLLVLLSVLALGARQGIQTRAFSSPWYPMVRWHEIAVLWPVGLTSILFYQATGFVILRNRLLASGRPVAVGHRKMTARVAFLGALLVLCILLILGRFVFAGVAGGVSSTPFGLLLKRAFPVYLGALTVLATLASLHCYRRLEVEP